MKQITQMAQEKGHLSLVAMGKAQIEDGGFEKLLEISLEFRGWE